MNRQAIEQELLDAINNSTSDEQAVDEISKIFDQIPESTEDPEATDVDIDTLEQLGPQLHFEEPDNAQFKVAHNVYINNAVETWDFAKPVTMIVPTSLRGTANAVRYIEDKGLSMRGLGSRHSYSDAVQTDHCYVDMSETTPYRPPTKGYTKAQHNKAAKKLDQTPLSRLKDSEDTSNYFNVAGGLKIHMLNELLWSSKYDNHFGERRLWNMGGGDVQSFAGALSTGTHGSGGKYSAYHDMVRSIVIVCSQGRIFRIEPDNGITDPDKHKKYYQDNLDEVPVQLIKNDDLFYSALVSMGCFGIIYSCVIEVAPKAYLKKNLTYKKQGWKDAKKDLDKLPADPNDEVFYSININPYKLKGKKHPSVVINECKISTKPAQTPKERKRNFWPSLFANSHLAALISRHLLTSGDYPKRILLERALRALNDHEGNKGKGYTNMSYKVLNAGTGKIKSMGTGIEFAFPVDKVAEIVDLIMANMEQIGKKGTGYDLNAPMTIRLVRSSNVFLAPNYHTHNGVKHDVWAYIELLRVNSKGKDDEEDKRELEIYHQLQMAMYFSGGRPHWGLNFNFPFNFKMLKKTYPKLEKWVNAYKFFNPNGTFDNDLTRDCSFKDVTTKDFLA